MFESIIATTASLITIIKFVSEILSKESKDHEKAINAITTIKCTDSFEEALSKAGIKRTPSIEDIAKDKYSFYIYMLSPLINKLENNNGEFLFNYGKILDNLVKKSSVFCVHYDLCTSTNYYDNPSGKAVIRIYSYKSEYKKNKAEALAWLHNDTRFEFSKILNEIFQADISLNINLENNNSLMDIQAGNPHRYICGAFKSFIYDIIPFTLYLKYRGWLKDKNIIPLFLFFSQRGKIKSFSFENSTYMNQELFIKLMPAILNVIYEMTEAKLWSINHNRKEAKSFHSAIINAINS